MKGLLCLLILIASTGCSSLFPRGESKIMSRWETFEEAKKAYDEIEPYQTCKAELDALGFAPDGRANVRILNHADIAERFMLISLPGLDNLPKGLKECLAKSGDCYAYEVERRVRRDKRYGNFLADLLNFKRKTETRGWEFNALVVLVDKRVVYKLWSGTPEIHEYRDQTNPLGPLQGIGSSFTPLP